jgi:methionyl-tRNA formyltransferase
MRLVFMGTPEFAEPSLRLLKETGYRIKGVFTQPDRPAGRGKKLKASPVKVLAESLGFTIFQPLKINTPEMLEVLRELNPECIVVVAYGQILSKEILSLPRYGCINVHASLLPAYRGAAPVHWAVINGEKRTGVTTMLMDEGLDTGDILLQSEYEITEDVNTGEVYNALAELGAKLLVSTLQKLESQSLKPVSQPQDGSYAPPPHQRGRKAGLVLEHTKNT